MIYLLSYAGVCVVLAAYNATLIKDGKRIYHAVNGAIHIVAAAAGWYFFGWQIGVSVLLVARVVFDVSLNLFRGLPVDYVSLNPKSIVDKAEKAIFGMNKILPLIIYVVLIVVINVFL